MTCTWWKKTCPALHQGPALHQLRYRSSNVCNQGSSQLYQTERQIVNLIKVSWLFDSRGDFVRFYKYPRPVTIQRHPPPTRVHFRQWTPKDLTTWAEGQFLSFVDRLLISLTHLEDWHPGGDRMMGEGSRVWNFFDSGSTWDRPHSFVWAS